MSRTRISGARVETIETPLRRSFVTALGRRERTKNVGITLRLDGGAEGYGEASTSLAMRRLSAPALAAALRRLAARSRGRDARAWRALAAEAWDREGALPPAAAAFESALLSALAAEAGTTLASWLGGRMKRVKSDLTISAWDDPSLAREAAAEAAAWGFDALKIKVGGALAADLERVRAVRRAAPRARLILDGNQGLSPRGALRLLDAVRRQGGDVLLLEQPTPKDDLRALAFVARRAGILVAADESAATPEQAARLLELGAATAINVKLAKSGLSRSLEIAALAAAAGAPLMIGCMAETARGLAASVHVALGTGLFRFVDLDSDLLLAEAPEARRAAGWVRRGPVLSLD
ncbi:MAG: dipeptide epimerase [Elusimicrobia bacterium]|nr:dipeptide epimerase [Elusimicrobiota bacterium]